MARFEPRFGADDTVSNDEHEETVGPTVYGIQGKVYAKSTLADNPLSLPSLVLREGSYVIHSSVSRLPHVWIPFADKVPSSKHLPTRVEAIHVAKQMSRIVQKSAGDSLSDVLDVVLEAADAPVVVSGGATTEAVEHELRALGSFVPEPPPLTKRASFRTTLRSRQVQRTSLGTKEAAELLGVSPGRIRQRAADRSLYSFQRKSHLYFPACQFTPDGELPGWSDLAQRIPARVVPVVLDTVMHLPSSELMINGERLSPRDWLEHGEPAAAVSGVFDIAFRLA